MQALDQEIIVSSDNRLSNSFNSTTGESDCLISKSKERLFWLDWESTLLDIALKLMTEHRRP